MKSLLAALLALSLGAGCSRPDPANIKLRKEKQELVEKIESLERQRGADLATIQSLETRATTVPVLPNDRLQKLFTVHGIKFGRLTGAGDQGLKLYIAPVDHSGEAIKAAGSFIVEAFDLAKDSDTRIGRWEFPTEQAARNWFGKLTMQTYILPIPLEKPPEHPQVTLKVTFTDELTGRQFIEQKVVNVPPKGL